MVRDVETIDFDALRATIDIGRVLTDYLGPPDRGGRWPCPIHGGERPNFTVHANRWKCFSCGESGDVFDFVSLREGITVAEAARRLDTRGLYARAPGQGPRPSAPDPPSGPDPRAGSGKPPIWADPEWQGAIEGLVSRAERYLHSKAGASAREWLRARGLDAATISRFRLGFLDKPAESDPIGSLGLDGQGRPRRVWASRGITIPWVRPGAWYSLRDGEPGDRWVGLNVRRLPYGDVFGDLPEDISKYMAVAGSERGHPYPWPEATAPGEPVVVCEGEFDTLVAWQELGWMVNTVSFGGAGQGVRRPDAHEFLNDCDVWLLLFDDDQAGDGAVRKWSNGKEYRCRRLFLPPGFKDLTELHVSGASLVEWLRSEVSRLGWGGTDVTRG